MAPGVHNLCVATGHNRNGILLAPVTAELVARDLAAL
jgi:glycine/D-amino acid oxidase-like deaminating enzyme